jgi:hypothetical protein
MSAQPAPFKALAIMLRLTRLFAVAAGFAALFAHRVRPKPPTRLQTVC